MRKLRETKMENKKSFSVLCPSFFSLAVERSENFKSVFARESTSLLREEKTRREIVTLNFATLSPRKLLRRYVSGVVVDDAHFSPEVAPITTVARKEWKEGKNPCISQCRQSLAESSITHNVYFLLVAVHMCYK